MQAWRLALRATPVSYATYFWRVLCTRVTAFSLEERYCRSSELFHGRGQPLPFSLGVCWQLVDISMSMVTDTVHVRDVYCLRIPLMSLSTVSKCLCGPPSIGTSSATEIFNV